MRSSVYQLSLVFLIVGCDDPSPPLPPAPAPTATPAPTAPLDDLEGRKVDAYTRHCVNAFAPGLWRLDQPGRADEFLWAHECRPTVEAQRRQPPSMPDVEEAAERLATAVEALDPLLRERERYYGRGPYADDMGARGAELDALIPPLVARAHAADADLRRALGRIRPRARAARIARLAAAPSSRLLLFERFAGQVAVVMRITSTITDEVRLPTDPADLGTAVPLLVQHADVLLASYGDDDFELRGCIEEFVRCARQLAQNAPAQTCSLDARYPSLALQVQREQQLWALPITYRLPRGIPLDMPLAQFGCPPP